MQLFTQALEAETKLDEKSKSILAQMATRLTPSQRAEFEYEVTLSSSVAHEHRTNALREIGDASNLSQWGLLHLSDAALDWLARWLVVYSVEYSG